MRLVQATLRVRKPTTRFASQPEGRRAWSSTPWRPTDGVYEELSRMRIQTPWIEALRKSRKGTGESSTDQEELIKPVMTPKLMSQSFTKFVRRIDSEA